MSSTPLYRKILRMDKLVDPHFRLTKVVKFEAAVPKWGPGHAGLRKFIQNQVGVFKFNSWPNLSTHFSNAPAKDAQSILKLHTSDGKIHELVVAGKRESDIVQLVKECEASQASHLSESMAEAQATK